MSRMTRAILLVTAPGLFVMAAPRAVAHTTSPGLTDAGMSATHVLRGHLLFSRAGGGYGDETEYFAGADGSHQHRLTPFSSTCCARISRNGKRILFAASVPGGRITTATVNPDGSGYHKIPLPDKTINLGPGAWSPDGRQIAFEGWDDHHPARTGLYLGSSSAGHVKRLTTAKVGHNVPGDFSPDGNRIVFWESDTGAGSAGSLWVVNVDGAALKRLTSSSLLVDPRARWSPDGTKILFANAGDQPRGDLWTIHPDGSHLTRVFHDRKGRFAITPSWSPDGKQIMFALDPTNHEDDHSPNGLYVINANGSGLTRAFADNTFKRNPDWVR